jgi:hypothetical protein
MKRTQSQSEQILQQAQALFGKGPSWVDYYRAVFGTGGIVRRSISEPEALDEFARTSQYRSIQLMLKQLRLRNQPTGEPTSMITVRLPVSVHEQLMLEATEKNTTLNKLCITKLLHQIDVEFIPALPPEPNLVGAEKDMPPPKERSLEL